MGYRSEVAIVIHGKAEALHRHYDAYLSPEANRVEAEDRYILEQSVEIEESAHGDEKYAEFRFHCEDFKWYQSYSLVQLLESFYKSSPDVGLSYEFLRIGEEDTDIEREDGGEESLYKLSMNRRIEFY